MNRTSVVTSTLVFTLVACNLFKKGDIDAGVDAGPDPVATTTAEPDVDSGSATVKPVVKVVKKDGGVDAGVDAGPVVVDAGSSVVDAAAAGIPAGCCCKVGNAFSRPNERECLKVKGTCVAQSECETRSCCCKVGDAKGRKFQNDCAAAKGTCVAKEQCL